MTSRHVQEALRTKGRWVHNLDGHDDPECTCSYQKCARCGQDVHWCIGSYGDAQNLCGECFADSEEP
jgi:hypothetical protein